MKYFSYDPSDGGFGFELHETAEKARARAQSCINDCIDCEGRWEEVVNEACWG